jgi:hypothetical protein
VIKMGYDNLSSTKTCLLFFYISILLKLNVNEHSISVPELKISYYSAPSINKISTILSGTAWYLYQRFLTGQLTLLNSLPAEPLQI